MLFRRLFSMTANRRSSFPDCIRLPDLNLKAKLPDYAWSAEESKSKLVLQPITVALEVHADLKKAGKSDDIEDSISYSTLTKIAQAIISENTDFNAGLEEIGQRVLKGVSEYASPILPSFQTKVSIQQHKTLFKSRSVELEISQRSGLSKTKSAFTIQDYRLDSLIGVNAFEREQKQPLFLDLHVRYDDNSKWQPHLLASFLEKHNSECEPLTLETYLEAMATSAFQIFPHITHIHAVVRKPFASKWAGPPTVSIRRERPLPAPSIPLLSTPRTLVMGIINLTPDSFGTQPSTLESSLNDAESQIKAGVDILDLGGVSTRPGAADVSEEEELQRVIPFVRELRKKDWAKNVVLSIDTFRARVAKKALAAGADWINDVKSGLHDPDFAMWKVVAEANCPVILMHSRGNAQTMNALAEYDSDIVGCVQEELLARVDEAIANGVRSQQIIVDPGIGFAKDAATNWELLRRLKEWHSGKLSQFPMLVGLSRKRFLGTLLDEADPVKRDVATAAATVECIRAGARIVRVHNPALCIDAVKTADALFPLV